MGTLAADLDRVAAETDFSGVVRLDRGGRTEIIAAYGLADRAHGVAMSPGTQLAIASGSKVLTALAVLSLVEEGALGLSTTVRSVLGPDLPLVGDDVTVEHLLAHRSGIGDYLDEDAGVSVSDYPMPVSVHLLATTEQFLAVLGGHPAKFRAGERFAYCNSGYVVLALVAERVSGLGFHDLVRHRVCVPAGLVDTDFLRSDALPGSAALGYVLVDGEWRTNVFHLPVLGNGDGGIYTTVADVHRFWAALFDGRIVDPGTLADMLRPRSHLPPDGTGYGLGMWLRPDGGGVVAEGCDAGVSFRSVHDPRAGVVHTVIANTTEGAWPVARLFDEHLAG